MEETQAPELELSTAPETVIPPVSTLPVSSAESRASDQNPSGQNIVSGQNSSQPVVSSPVTSMPVRVVKTAAVEENAPSTPKTPIEILQDVMKAQGMDPSTYKMESVEEIVMYPGGNFLHRYTKVDLPNGYSEKFSTDLMSKFPEVTANELARIMRMGTDGPLSGMV